MFTFTLTCVQQTILPFELLTNVFLTFIDEPDPFQADVLRYRLGVENIMWSSDYPHPVSSWPKSRELIERSMADVPDDERDLILGGNAARVWNL